MRATSDENNLFDDDNALIYKLYEEANKEDLTGGKGCFGSIVLLILPLIIA